MSQAEQPSFALDRTGVALIFALVVVVGPTTILASLWILTHGFELAASTTFERIVSALVTLLALYMIRVGVRELRGGLGVRIDDEGIGRGRTHLRWAEVERVTAPSFGALELAGAGKSVRVQTYLFREPKRLRDFVVAKTGVAIPAS